MYRNQCLICKQNNSLKEVLDLGYSPWCNNFTKKKKVKEYPLILVKCKNCLSVQLNYFIKKEVMFTNHDYISGVNIELKIHFKKVVQQILKKNQKFLNILDIGSNDGSFLECFPSESTKIGFEPCKKIKVKDRSIHTIRDFFNYKSAKKINIEFDFIHASGVFFHLEELHSVTKGIKHLLKTDGVYIIQFLYLKNIFEKIHFDQIYHEHLIYYSINSINIILNNYDLEIFDICKSKIHGGSLIAFVGHKGLKNKTKRYKTLLKKDLNWQKKFDKKVLIFKKKINFLKKRIHKFILLNKKNNNRIIALGAPAKATTLLKVFNLNYNKLDFCLEINKSKIGMRLPNSDIIVKSQNNFKFKKNDCFIILSWNFKKTILKNFLKNNKKKITIFNPHIYE